ncbi:MAG: hypothetical protein WAU32_03205 [Thermoanaerobaculia bacterium]
MNAERRSSLPTDVGLPSVVGCLAALGMTILAASLSASEPARLEARFIGNMAFAISDETTTLYTDFPYESGAFGYMTYDFDAVPKASVALCLITHGHRDHFDAPLFLKMDAKIIAPPTLAAILPSARVIPFAPTMVYRDIRVEALKTPHGTMDHDSYLVTWHGLRLYFTGDTDSTERLLAAKNLDYAFVSPWLLEAVAGQKKRIDAREVIVYHQRADEKVPPIQNAVVPKQGDTLVLRAGRN